MNKKHEHLAKLVIINKDIILSDDILGIPSEYDVKAVFNQGDRTFFEINISQPLLEAILNELIYTSNQEINSYETSLVFIKYCLIYFEVEEKKLNRKKDFLGNHFIPYIFQKAKVDYTQITTANFSENIIFDKLVLQGLLKLIGIFNFSLQQIYDILTKSVDFKLKYQNDLISFATTNTDKAIHFLKSFFRTNIINSHQDIYRLFAISICRVRGLESIEILKSYFDYEENQWIILNAISQITCKNHNDFEKLEAFTKKTSLIEKNQFELINFYITLLEKNHNSEIGQRCFFSIKEILNSENENVLSYILKCIDTFEIPEETIIEILSLYLDNPNHSSISYKKVSQNLNLFDSILTYKIKRSSLFFEFLKIFVKKTGYINHNSLDNAIKYHISQSYNDTLDLLLSCFINNNGNIRHLGNYLIPFLHNAHKNVKFNNKLSKLHEDELIKLALSISIIPSLNFKENLRLIISLIYHQNSKIQQLLFKIISNKFEKEDGILALLEEELVDDDDKKTIIDYFKKREDSFLKYRQMKRDVNEFSPRFTQYKYFNLFQEHFSKRWSKTLEEDLKDDTIMGIFGGNPILVLKNGGWRISKNSPIQQMQHFQSSSSIPALAFLNPDKDTIEIQAFFSQDWSDKQLIEQWLKKFS